MSGDLFSLDKLSSICQDKIDWLVQRDMAEKPFHKLNPA